MQLSPSPRSRPATPKRADLNRPCERTGQPLRRLSGLRSPQHHTVRRKIGEPCSIRASIRCTSKEALWATTVSIPEHAALSASANELERTRLASEFTNGVGPKRPHHVAVPRSLRIVGTARLQDGIPDRESFTRGIPGRVQ